MLSPSQFKQLADMVENKSAKTELARFVNELRLTLNPHPAGQMEHNVPVLKGKTLLGIQHKYRETILFFPSQGQTCHAYCTFCFRWPQFTGQSDLKFSSKQPGMLVAYLKDNPAVTDILFTGGDPMVLNTTERRSSKPKDYSYRY
jgi:L-lysine 2,3-aminomutase